MLPMSTLQLSWDQSLKECGGKHLCHSWHRLDWQISRMTSFGVLERLLYGYDYDSKWLLVMDTYVSLALVLPRFHVWLDLYGYGVSCSRSTCFMFQWRFKAHMYLYINCSTLTKAQQLGLLEIHSSCVHSIVHSRLYSWVILHRIPVCWQKLALWVP
jgi:hypothetical protein